MASYQKVSKAACIVALAAFLTALHGCGGGGSSSSTPASYSVSAAVVGLSGSGLALSLNGGTAIPVSSDGTVTFPSLLSGGSSYSVTVASNPANPGQTCGVTLGTGTIANSNVVNVGVNCTTDASTTIQSVVSMSASIPSAGAALVTSISSTAQSGTVGSTISIPWTPSGMDSPVFALSDSGDIVLAAMTRSAGTTLDIDSTAIALTRMLMGQLAATTTPHDVEVYIRAAGEYPHLVQLIADALAAGQIPSTSPGVLASVNLLESQLPTSIKAQSASVQSARVVRASLATPRVDSTPYRLVSATGTDFLALHVVAADNSGNVLVDNGMPIAWEATSTAANGGALCIAGASSCIADLPAVSITWGAVTAFSDFAKYLTAVPVAGNGDAINLSIAQSDATRTANTRKVLHDSIALALDATLPSDTCIDALSSALVSPEQLTSFLVEPLPTTFRQYLTSLTLDKVKSLVATALTKCTNSNAAANTVLAELKLVYAESLVSAIHAVDLGATLGLTLRYWNTTPNLVGVCETKGILFGYNISSCATSFQFDKPVLYLAPGVTTQGYLPTAAKDAAMNATAVPTNLVFTTDNPAKVVVNSPTGVVATSAFGPFPAMATISVNYEPTGVSPGTYQVSLSIPNITPASSTINAGDAINLVLADSAGNLMTVPPEVTWSVTTSASGTTLVPQIVAASGVRYLAPDNDPPGTVTVRAIDQKHSIEYGSATVTVVAGAVGKTFTIASTCLVNGAQETWVFDGSTIAITSAQSGTFDPVLTLNGTLTPHSATTIGPIDLAGDLFGTKLPLLLGTGVWFNGDIKLYVDVNSASATGIAGQLQYLDNVTGEIVYCPFNGN